MKVLIADDHGIVRSGITLLLERQADIDVIGEASDGAGGAEADRRPSPRRGDPRQLDAEADRPAGCREVKQQAPEVNVLLLVDARRRALPVRSACALVPADTCLKRAADQDLVRAVRAVNDGEPFLTDDAQRSLVKAWMESGEEPPPRQADRPRARSRQADRRGAHQQADRRDPRPEREDSRVAPLEHLEQAGHERPR